MGVTYKKFTITRTQDVYVKIDPDGKDGFLNEWRAEEEAFDFAAGNTYPETIRFLAWGECGDPYKCPAKVDVEADEALGYFESSRVAQDRVVADGEISRVIRYVDWDLLAKQKLEVLDYYENGEPVKSTLPPSELIDLREGLLNFIDALQDVAVKCGLWSDEEQREQKGMAG